MDDWKTNHDQSFGTAFLCCHLGDVVCVLWLVVFLILFVKNSIIIRICIICIVREVIILRFKEWYTERTPENNASYKSSLRIQRWMATEEKFWRGSWWCGALHFVGLTSLQGPWGISHGCCEHRHGFGFSWAKYNFSGLLSFCGKNMERPYAMDTIQTASKWKGQLLDSVISSLRRSFELCSFSFWT